MIIHPRVSLRKVTIGDVSMIIPSKDVKAFKDAFPNIRVESRFPRNTNGKRDMPGPCVSIPVSEYMQNAH